MKILLTGESGMLATAIKTIQGVKESLIDTSALKQFKNDFHFLNNKQVKDFEWDITEQENYKILDDLVDNNTVIIHTAAYVNTDKCESFSFEAVKSNVLGTQMLVDLANKHNCIFINFSTTAVFDPDTYMLPQYSGVFDESCKIDPKTIYGMTKFNAELAVKQSVSRHITIKPVFIYGDAPFDNSSNIRKVIEFLFLKKYKEDKDPLNITLDIFVQKNYMRYEFFALMFERILTNCLKLTGKDFIISRDPKAGEAWGTYLNIIAEIMDIHPNVIYNNIKHLPEKDYLQKHLGYSKNFYSIFNNFKLSDEAYDNKDGIRKTFLSIKNLYTTENV